MVDVLRIIHTREARDLAAAVRVGLRGEHERAQGAEHAVRVAAVVLSAMLGKDQDLSRTVAGFHPQLPAADTDAWFRQRADGALIVTRGTTRHWPLAERAWIGSPSFARLAGPVLLPAVRSLLPQTLRRSAG